jgi:hypothetical protein
VPEKEREREREREREEECFYLGLFSLRSLRSPKRRRKHIIKNACKNAL